MHAVYQNVITCTATFRQEHGLDQGWYVMEGHMPHTQLRSETSAAGVLHATASERVNQLFVAKQVPIRYELVKSHSGMASQVRSRNLMCPALTLAATRLCLCLTSA